MPDGAQTQTGRGFGGLTPIDEFIDRCLPQRNGKPLGRRARQKIIKRCGIRVIRIGRNGFVEEEFEAQRLREIAQRDMLPRRGRPRKVQLPASANRGADTAPALSALGHGDGTHK